MMMKIAVVVIVVVFVIVVVVDDNDDNDDDLLLLLSLMFLSLFMLLFLSLFFIILVAAVVKNMPLSVRFVRCKILGLSFFNRLDINKHQININKVFAKSLNLRKASVKCSCFKSANQQKTHLFNLSYK